MTRSHHLREISPLSPRGHPALRPIMHHASGSDHRNVVVPLSLPCHCAQHRMFKLCSRSSQDPTYEAAFDF
jgi:hypothetical protein